MALKSGDLEDKSASHLDFDMALFPVEWMWTTAVFML